MHDDYKDFIIEGKQSLTLIIHPPSNFKYIGIIDDEVWKGLELELLQVSSGEKEDEGIEMF